MLITIFDMRDSHTFVISVNADAYSLSVPKYKLFKWKIISKYKLFYKINIILNFLKIILNQYFMH